MALALAGSAILLLRPECLILKYTGFYCAGCGTQHMVWALLRGDLSGAVYENIFMMIFLPAALLYAGAELVRYVQGKPLLYRRKAVLTALCLLLIAGMLFTVLRNLPDFQWLAPAWAAGV